MNKKGLQWRELILAIIALAVVAITIFFFAPQFSKLFALFKPDFEDLSLSEKSKLEANFNQLIENIKACRNIDDYECLCSGLPDFPSTFRQECQLEVEQKDKNTTITLLFNKKKALSADIEQIQISAVRFSKGWSESPYFKELGEKKIIDFELLKITEWKKVEGKDVEEEKWYPFFQPKSRLTASKMPILSDQLYKLSGSSLAFTVLPGVGFVTKTGEEVKKQTEARQKSPKCLPKRLDAIKEFDKVVNALKKGEERELTIELPQNYRIWIYNNKSIALQYKKEEKSELVERHGETLQEKFVYVLFTFDIKCKEPEKGEFLLDGDKIKIKKTAEAVCLEKV